MTECDLCEDNDKNMYLTLPIFVGTNILIRKNIFKRDGSCASLCRDLSINLLFIRKKHLINVIMTQKNTISKN